MGEKNHWMRTYQAEMVNMKCQPSEEGLTFKIEYPAVSKRDAIIRAKRNFPGMTMVGIKRTGRYRITRTGSAGEFADWLSAHGTG